MNIKYKFAINKIAAKPNAVYMTTSAQKQQQQQLKNIMKLQTFYLILYCQHSSASYQFYKMPCHFCSPLSGPGFQSTAAIHTD